VLIVAGKGGVGSSTVAAAVALLAAGAGRDVLLVSVDGKAGLGAILGGPALTDREQLLWRAPTGSRGRIRGRTIPPRQAFGDYLDLRGVGGLLRRAAQAASLDAIAASTPGLEHLLVLGKIKELERTRAADLIVVDAPPSGHAGPFLRSAFATQELVSRGPLRDQADQVAALLADPQRTNAMVVTIPEETPVNEAIELSTDLDGLIGLALTPLVVNCCWAVRPGLVEPTTTVARAAGVKITVAQRSALVASSRYGASRLAVQREQLDRIDDLLPAPRIELPRLANPRLDIDDIARLAEALREPPVEPGVGPVGGAS